MDFISELFLSQINFHMSINSLNWKETLFGKPVSLLLFFKLFIAFFSQVVLQKACPFQILCSTSFFRVPFLMSSSHYKMASKSLCLVLLLSKIDTCNRKWRNEKLSTTGVKFSWILHKRFFSHSWQILTLFWLRGKINFWMHAHADFVHST